ncbi:MAG: DUF4834 family protein [Bacteroidales bacterium]|nr:DUF4834 family protein [Bacteroidales bacterium]
MSFFGLIFIIFLIWIVPKLIRGFLFVNNIKKQSRKMYEQMYNGGQRDSQPRSRKPGWSEPQPHKKKIDPNVGEYVSFQEITSTETETTTTDPATGARETTYTVEQQVTDAEWVDLPAPEK